jgi:hypothetical protein
MGIVDIGHVKITWIVVGFILFFVKFIIPFYIVVWIVFNSSYFNINKMMM